MVTGGGKAANAAEITYSQLLSKVNAGQVKSAEINGAHVVITDQSNKPYSSTTPNNQDDLVKRLEMAERARMEEVLRPLGVTLHQYTAMSILERREGLSSAQLARRHVVSPQAMHQLIASMERDRLVERRPDAANRRILRIWLTDVVMHGSGRNDAILLRHAHRTGSDRATLNELATAIAPSRERRAETLDQGTAFIAAAAAWHPPELPERVAYPVAVGALAGRYGIDEDTTTAAYLQAFTTNLISAAVRLVPLGQSAGLRVLAELEPIILQVAAESRAARLDDLGGCAFRSDLAAMRHETQYTRLFRS